MRKEVRTVVVSTATHIVDRSHRETGVSQLKLDELAQVAMRPLAAPIDDRSTCCGPLQLARDLLADLEGAHSNVRANRGDELSGIVRQRLDRFENDTSDRATPPCMYRSNVSTRGMSDQNRHAVGSSRGDCDSRGAHDQSVSLPVHDNRCVIDSLDFSNHGSVHLALLEQAREGNTEALGKPCTVLMDRIGRVSQMKTEVQRVVWRFADPAFPRCERVPKAVPTEEG